MNKVPEIFAEFKRRRRDIEMPLAEVKKELARFAGRVFLYGAGSSGVAFLYFLRRVSVEPMAFIDADPEKQGRGCEGLAVIAPKEAAAKAGGEFLVIVCINTDGKRYCKSFAEALRVGGHHGVYQQRYDAGCSNVVDYTFFRHCFALFTEEKYNAPSCSDVDLMLRHEEEIAQVHDVLADALSKEILEKILCFRLLDDTLTVPTMKQEDQYFEPEFYEPREDAVFIDCGAFNGISAETFFRRNGEAFSSYYGMEPDPANFRQLQQYAKTLSPAIQEKVHLYEKATWQAEEMVPLYALSGPGSFFAPGIGQTMVEGLPIDRLPAEKVTFIKMNIEGSEKEALAGAERTIRRDKPQLAIAGYHRTADLWEIPLLIRRFREDYHLSLRSYMNHISFVYYGK